MLQLMPLLLSVDFLVTQGVTRHLRLLKVESRMTLFSLGGLTLFPTSLCSQVLLPFDLVIHT